METSRVDPHRRLGALSVLAVAGLLGGGLLRADASASGTAQEASAFVPVTPTRVLDTRIDVGLDGRFVHGAGRLIPLTGEVPVVLPGDVAGSAEVVPAGATGVIANVTAVTPTTRGHVSVRPGTATGEPTTSNINFTTGGVIAPNSVTVELPTDGPAAGAIELYFHGTSASATTDLLVDVVGYFAASAGGPPGPPGPAGPTGMSGWEKAFALGTVAQGQRFGSADVICPDGKYPVGGGSTTSNEALVLVESAPVGLGWRATYATSTFTPAGANRNFAVHVICVILGEEPG